VKNQKNAIGARATFGRRWSSVEVGGRSSTFAGAVRERERERKQPWMQRECRGRENMEGERNFFSNFTFNVNEVL
jgi:hypothetical protein